MGVFAKEDGSPVRLFGLSGRIESYFLNTLCLICTLAIGIWLATQAAVSDVKLWGGAAVFFTLSLFTVILMATAYIKERQASP